MLVTLLTEFDQSVTNQVSQSTMKRENCRILWDLWPGHVKQIFQNLKTLRQFSDVTLVCADKTEVRAHQFILTACSSVFKDILANTSHPQPLIYLRGIQHEILESVLQFMYEGEANIYQDRMPEFLKLAKEFDVLGLNILPEELGRSSQNKVNQETKVVKKFTMETLKEDCPGSDREDKEVLPESIHALEDLKKQHQLYQCKDCGQLFPPSSYSELRQHVLKCNPKLLNSGQRAGKSEATPQFPCLSCDHTASSDFSLKLHQKMVHEKQKNIKYIVRSTNTENSAKMSVTEDHHGVDQPIDISDIRKNVKDEPVEEEEVGNSEKETDPLEEDVDSPKEISEVVKPKLFCDKCDFSTEQEEDLKTHSRAEHEEVSLRYQCPKCNFKGIDKQSTKEHYMSSHEGALFACKQCEFRTRDKAQMYKHIKSNHK